MRCFLLLALSSLSTGAMAQTYHSSTDKEVALHVVKPEYPYAARAYHLQGNGIYLLHLRPNGTVRSVDVKKSTGYKILDDAVVTAYRQWRFRPDTTRTTITVPLSFTMTPQ